jgi:S1-C subfamily serine protease
MNYMRFALAALFVLLGSSAHAFHNTKEAIDAVVGIHAEIPDDAFTARTLGTVREGSGVVIDDKGHIVTVGYLVLEADLIEVTGPDGKTVGASFVGYDNESGLGLIKADLPLEAKPVEIGRSSDLEDGEPLIVAGRRAGAQAVLVVSRQEFAGNWEYMLDDAIFATPAYAEYGGAALINHDGQLVGIGSLLTQVFMPSVGPLAVNMFVPIDLLPPVLDDLIRTGRPRAASRPWMGVNVAETQGRVFVTGVTESGPAANAGLGQGDIILTVDGKAVKGLSDLYRKVWALGEAGVKVRMSVLQGTQVRRLTIDSSDRFRFLKSPPRRRRGTLTLGPFDEGLPATLRRFSARTVSAGTLVGGAVAEAL